MTAAAFSPASSTSDQERSPRTWKPDGDAHLIYQLVKMQGKSQDWVANVFRIHQSTVSRIIQRYERWQAHAHEREDGRLDPAERLRSQRWQTFERNEMILASCLRIANKMEDFFETSRSTIRRDVSQPGQDLEVRTQLATIDRTGIAARFLRLAFKINMEQLKLADLAQPPLAQPLSAEEQAIQEREAAEDAAELAAARSRPRGVDIPPAPSAEPPTEDAVAPIEPISQADSPATLAESGDQTAVAMHDLHNLHPLATSNTVATSAAACGCVVEARIDKKVAGVSIRACSEPKPCRELATADVLAATKTG